MGERKGTNLYYPPDYDPKAGGLNKFLGTHALRERARKIHLGILIIRFEMPYNIWCDGCNNHIGMGVRYNAEKTKIGMYYTTPIYQFKMKCHLCDNHFEIKTDPGNLDYVIVSGARRQENRWDPLQNEQVVPETKETQKRLFDDPMFKLEHGASDLKAGEDAKPVLAKLYQRNENTWNDCYESNKILRDSFRKRKKELQSIEEKDNALLKKASLDIKLVEENKDDIKLASLLAMKPNKVDEKTRHMDILNKPVLQGSTVISFGGLRREKLLKSSLSTKSLGILPKNHSSASSTITSTEQKSEKEISATNITSSKLLCNYSSSDSDS
ncbi:coiled-coil domain-containing protein 130 homolog [Ctenocephalides felis]|uniref:coiled-coil domain-containing protein 130 homolog n=1 Tax=Ctenocephalides felis TaxID=7515 RepID=UPI000E6E20DC|nr:coiled-coil domain-containing protein 130 homolog [Ctenocephalides felis]